MLWSFKRTGYGLMSRHSYVTKGAHRIECWPPFSKPTLGLKPSTPMKTGHERACKFDFLIQSSFLLDRPAAADRPSIRPSPARSDEFRRCDEAMMMAWPISTPARPPPRSSSPLSSARLGRSERRRISSRRKKVEEPRSQSVRQRVSQPMNGETRAAVRLSL